MHMLAGSVCCGFSHFAFLSFSCLPVTPLQLTVQAAAFVPFGSDSSSPFSCPPGVQGDVRVGSCTCAICALTSPVTTCEMPLRPGLTKFDLLELGTFLWRSLLVLGQGEKVNTGQADGST